MGELPRRKRTTNFSNFSFPEINSVADYVFFVVFFYSFSSVTSFRRQFLRQMSPIQLAVICFIVRKIFPSFLTIRNTFRFTHDWSNCSSSHFTNTTLQNLQSISVLLSEASKFQRCTKLRSKCTIYWCFPYI
jgi:hypothetical protein